MDYLSPYNVNVVIDRFDETAPAVQDALKSRMTFSPESVSQIELDTTTCFHFHSGTMSNKRRLVVVWDDSIPRKHYYQYDSCIIFLANNEDTELMIRNNNSEINVFTYLYFHRGECSVLAIFAGA